MRRFIATHSSQWAECSLDNISTPLRIYHDQQLNMIGVSQTEFKAPCVCDDLHSSQQSPEDSAHVLLTCVQHGARCFYSTNEVKAGE